MFKWLKRKKDYRKASITYYVDGDGIVKLDMSLADFSDDSIMAISSIIKLLAHEMCVIETFDFFKKSMQNSKKEDVIIKALVNIGEDLNKKIIQEATENFNNNSPFIKPSDL